VFVCVYATAGCYSVVEANPSASLVPLVTYTTIRFNLKQDNEAENVCGILERGFI